MHVNPGFPGFRVIAFMLFMISKMKAAGRD